jgi:threonine dehydrogenase-like Zn-dependent dehydrogenase
VKTLVWTAPRVMALDERPVPDPGPDEVLIRVTYAGICGSELNGYLGHNSLLVPPLVFGHEFSGVITALGYRVGADFPHLLEGRPVTVNPLAGCGHCPHCAERQRNRCAARKLIGAHFPGGYAEYAVVPAANAVPLPLRMTARTGALTEPASVGFRIGELCGDVMNEDIFVAGAGPIGLFAMQALRLRGAARLFISDTHPARLAMGEALGGIPVDPRTVDVITLIREATGGRGVAAAVDAVGIEATREQCVKATRIGGTVVLSGLHDETGPFPAADIIRREIVVRGSYCYSDEDFQSALGHLDTGEMRLDPWIEEAPLEEGGTWFERLLSEPGNVSKVLLRP